MFIQMDIACGGKVDLWSVAACKALMVKYAKKRSGLTFDDVAGVLGREYGFRKEDIQASQFVPSSHTYTALDKITFMTPKGTIPEATKWALFPDEVIGLIPFVTRAFFFF